MTRLASLLLGFLTMLNVALVIAVVILIALLSNLNQRETMNQQGNTRALCALRDDLNRRVDSGLAFLRTHPHGIPGISAGSIRQSLNGQERTIIALRPVVCKK